jgi:uncharacterized protein (TIGR02611 family)
MVAGAMNRGVKDSERRPVLQEETFGCSNQVAASGLSGAQIEKAPAQVGLAIALNFGNRREAVTRRAFENTCTTTYKLGKKVVIAVVGSTIVAVGVAMIVLPGPAIVVIPLGFGVLAVEFAWAKRFLDRLKEESASTLDRLRALRST